ncbi:MULTISPECIES: hypothetical protein [Pseudoalteromonas]|uniref:secretion/conjugation apparatus DotM-related subunit n=1 Tax=Pseudoalteromonas TaxID=53246 RepID=UPI001581E02F|nr:MULTISPECIES: hypothetical protein [Pseudoalteromonas]MDI4652586.1 hypothetical protein [Pseudoalteromonas shioyasakiensis]NUJ38706.1 hypothetical protein [Pseudoalteromonas sp. 0303]
MANSNPQNHDIGAQIFVIIAIIVGVYALWFTTGHYIVNTAVLISVALINASNFIYDLLPEHDIIDSIYFLLVDEMFITDKEAILRQMQLYKSSRPSLSDARDVFYVIGYFLRFPILILGVWGSYLCYRYSRPSQLKRKFDIFTLANHMQAHFPQIRPALLHNLIKSDFNKGPHRQEASPIRYAILKGALSYVDEDGVIFKVKFGKKLQFKNKSQTMTIIDSYDVDEGLPVLHKQCLLDLTIIRRNFAKQITKLGRWENPDKLPPQIKALYAVFLLMIKGGDTNKEKAFAMLDRFSATFRSTKAFEKSLTFDDTGVDDVIAEFGNQVAVKKIQKAHTYASTVLVALYHRATHRRSKLPPSRFPWLKEVDRDTWYSLHHNLSPAAWTESAGSRGLWLTERKLKEKANFPFTDNAINGYLKYINSEGWLLEQPNRISEVVS